jgi:Sulfotransferase domain
VIIGALRSGTTSLARHLGAHPQVFVASQKEVRFFSDYYERGLDWYASQFAKASSERAVGEASPIYMYSDKAMARMAAALPEVQLVAILRNPVDRAYSHYWMMRARGQEALEFSEAIAAETNRVRSGIGALAYLEYSRYLRHLRMVCEHFPREALHVILLERFIEAPREGYQSLCRFVGIDETFVPPNLEGRVNNFVEIRSGGLRRLARRLSPPVRRVVDRLNVRQASYPPLDPALRDELTSRFEQENRELASWLGWGDLPW